MKPIPIAGPWITEKEVAYVTEAVRHSWYEHANTFQNRFEEAMKRTVHRKYAVSLPSCTSAIHLALAALGIGPGDEVIVPDITWIASAAPVSYLGATPVFADIDTSSWCLSPEALAASITPRTKAVIVVDLYGNMPQLDRILDLAARHHLAVIEDAAQAIGSTYRGKPAGSFGTASVFSFHGSKTLTTGEGGMLVTDDEALSRRVLFLRNHGRPPGDTRFQNTEVAYKYRMSDLQAALGLAQLERLPELIEKKRHIFSLYKKHLKNIPGLTLNPEQAGVENSVWMVTVILDSKQNLKKDDLMASLSEHGIAARPFFHPLSSLPAYANDPSARPAQSKNKNAYALSPYGVNLPSALNLTPEQIEFVCRKVKEAIRVPDPVHRP